MSNRAPGRTLGKQHLDQRIYLTYGISRNLGEEGSLMSILTSLRVVHLLAKGFYGQRTTISLIRQN